MESSLDDPYPAGLLLAVLSEPSSLFTYVIGGVTLIILLLLSALISGSEVAFFSFSHLDIEFCRHNKKPAYVRVLHLLENPKRLLATILILNNTVNIAFVTIATYISWEIFGVENVANAILVWLTAITTTLLVFFGEVLPKVYANQYNVRFARLTSYFLFVSLKVFKPVSWLLLNMSNVIERNVEQKGYELTLDELSHALEITTDETTTNEEKEILRGIVNFSNLGVKQVMRSRLDITAFDIETDFHELMDRVNKTGFSRIPIYDETIDQIKGILYIKDLLPHLHEEDTFAWQTLLRPGYFVPETKKIDTLLRDFQEKRVHMAIVVDEYGGTSGLITLEDVIEEIVGEINDEFDDDEIAFNKLDENTFVFEGKTTLNDFSKVIGVDPVTFEPVKGESESLGGLLLELHAKLPRTGEKIRYDRFLFTVVSVDHRRIKRVRVYVSPTEEVQ